MRRRERRLCELGALRAHRVLWTLDQEKWREAKEKGMEGPTRGPPRGESLRARAAADRGGRAHGRGPIEHGALEARGQDGGELVDEALLLGALHEHVLEDL